MGAVGSAIKDWELYIKAAGDSRWVSKESNTLYVDPNTAAGYTTIQAAFTAASDGDVVLVAPGDYTGEGTLSVPAGVTLYVEGRGTTIAGVDFNTTGTLIGRLGQIEWHANGAIVSPVESASVNGDNALIAWNAGRTNGSSERFAVGLVGAARYDFVNATLTTANGVFDMNATNAHFVDFYGIGVLKPEIYHATAGRGFDLNGSADAPQLKLRNLTLNFPALNAIGIYLQGNNDNCFFEDVDVEADDAYLGNNGGTGSTSRLYRCRFHGLFRFFKATSTAVLSDVSAADMYLLTSFDGVANISGGGLVRMPTNGTMNGDIVVSGSTTVVLSSGLTMAGALSGLGSVGLSASSNGVFNIKNFTPASTNNLIENGGVAQDGSFFDNISGKTSFMNGKAYVEDGAVWRNGTQDISAGSTYQFNQSVVENKGQYNDFLFIGNNTEIEGFPVSDGAELQRVSFQDYATYAVQGRNILNSTAWGSTGGAKYNGSDTVTFHLSAEPQKGDGAGGKTGMGGDIFDLGIHQMPVVGGGQDMSALEGRVFEFEVHQDVAGTYGYGAGAWVLRSTATDASEIATLLGASPLETGGGSNTTRSGIAALVTLLNVDLGGASMGPEIKPTYISSITGTGVTDISADYMVNGADSVVHVDASSGAVDISCFPAANQPPLTIKVVDATNNVTITPDGAETIDGAASFVLTTLNETVTVYSDGSNLFIR